MQKKLFVINTFTALLLCMLLVGCTNTAPDEVIPAEESSEVSEVEVFETASVSSSSSALSTQAISYGYGTKDRDALNRPNSCLTYQEQYGDLSALFIGENDNVIYLTFDQGYENGFTGTILDTLKEKNVPAVFFVTGHYVNTNPELIRRMIDEGHAIGNHSYSHPSGGLPSLSTEEQIEDTKELHELLLSEFGYTCTLYRFPAGIFSEQCMATIQELGYTSVFWSFAYQDWLVDDQPDEAESLEKMLSQLHPGAIYLLHAVSETNANILGEFIDEVRSAGYEFALMTAS